MKKASLIIISLCFSILILSSVVYADVISPGTSSKDPGTSSKDESNSLWIFIAAIIGIIAIISWLVIIKIKKNFDSKKEPKIKA